MIIENKSDSKRTREAVHLYPIPNDHGYFNSKKKNDHGYFCLQQKQEVLTSSFASPTETGGTRVFSFACPDIHS